MQAQIIGNPIRFEVTPQVSADGLTVAPGRIEITLRLCAWKPPQKLWLARAFEHKGVAYYEIVEDDEDE